MAGPSDASAVALQTREATTGDGTSPGWPSVVSDGAFIVARPSAPAGRPTPAIRPAQGTLPLEQPLDCITAARERGSADDLSCSSTSGVS